jgi:hypothetical protein
MKTYIIGNLILAPFVVAAYTSRESAVLCSVILFVGFGFSIFYLFKQSSNK